MPIARSRYARRREFTRTHGALNLIPLVDILTAIVFFSLLGAVSLRSALASIDLVAPPAVAEAGEAGGASSPHPDLVIRVDRNQFVVRQGDRETVVARAHARDEASFAQLRQSLMRIAGVLGRPAVVTVVPSDDVSYDDVVRVLENVQRVKPAAVALGARARMPSK